MKNFLQEIECEAELHVYTDDDLYKLSGAIYASCEHMHNDSKSKETWLVE